MSDPQRLGRWFADTGWIHLLLVVSAGLFLFPFVWMANVSIKTDEELTDGSFFAALPRFTASSPHLRPAAGSGRPADLPVARWTALRPALDAAASAALARAPQPAAAGTVDPAAWRAAAQTGLVVQVAARLPLSLWQGDASALVAAFDHLATPDAVRQAYDETLARVDLLSLQLKTVDARIFNLAGEGGTAHFTVESGPATVGDDGRLAYAFPDAGAAPVVLRCDFTIPAGVRFADLHKLILSLRPDDSWHRLDATLDWEGRRWASQRTTSLAQHRVMAVLLQPPGFDDTTNRARTWVPLADTGAATTAQGVATLRVTVAPSSTLRAIWGKIERNYARAFHSVPFWTYVGNSLALVVLSMAGALFSSAFVAYAFARLRWPGRGVALVLLLSTMMLPAQVTMIPSFLIWRELGWYNTLNPLWVPAFFGNAFFIFLMIQQMKTIPRELEEAARIDSCNTLQTWWYVIVPQVRPTLAAIAIMSFMGAWNEFMGPLIYLRDQERFPLSLGLFGMRVDNGGDWTMIMAGNLLMTVPVVLIFFCFQRYFIQGMTTTGMKG